MSLPSIAQVQRWNVSDEVKTRYVERIHAYRRRTYERAKAQNYLYSQLHPGYVNPRTEFASWTRRHRPSGLCRICRLNPADTWDHILPLSRGGSNAPENLRPACRSCNSRRNNFTSKDREREIRRDALLRAYPIMKRFLRRKLKTTAGRLRYLVRISAEEFEERRRDNARYLGFRLAREGWFDPAGFVSDRFELFGESFRVEPEEDA